jgi:hypothetical protein
MAQFYTIGFEDGFSGSVFRTEGMTPQQAFLYRRGFESGEKAAEKFSFWTIENE